VKEVLRNTGVLFGMTIVVRAVAGRYRWKMGEIDESYQYKIRRLFFCSLNHEAELWRRVLVTICEPTTEFLLHISWWNDPHQELLTVLGQEICQREYSVMETELLYEYYPPMLPLYSNSAKPREHSNCHNQSCFLVTRLRHRSSWPWLGVLWWPDREDRVMMWTWFHLVNRLITFRLPHFRSWGFMSDLVLRISLC
jgi:hypothetical protein